MMMIVMNSNKRLDNLPRYLRFKNMATRTKNKNIILVHHRHKEKKLTIDNNNNNNNMSNSNRKYSIKDNKTMISSSLLSEKITKINNHIILDRVKMSSNSIIAEIRIIITRVGSNSSQSKKIVLFEM